MLNLIAPLLPQKKQIPEFTSVLGLDSKPIFWHDLLHSRALVDYDVYGTHVGAFWLSKYKGVAKKPTFVFGWNLDGIHVYDLQLIIQSFYDDWVGGLKAIPFPYASWIIHMRSEKASNDRIIQLSDILRNGRPEDIQIVMDEIARTQELSRSGKRVKRSINLYAFYHSAKDRVSDSSDAIDNTNKEIFQAVKDLKKSVTGAKTAEEAIDYEHLFQVGFSQGYLDIHNILKNRFGWSCTPLTAKQLWANARAIFSGDVPGECPYVIDVKINNAGVNFTEPEELGLNIPDALVKDGNPVFDRQWVYIKRWDEHLDRYRDDYIGVLFAKGKFKEWAHEYHQLKAIHDLYECEDISDIEIILELIPSNAKTHMKTASEMRKNALKKIERLSETKDYSPAAKQELRESEENIDDIYSDAGTLRASFVILVHSTSPQKLDMDCRTVMSNFTVADLYRETTAAHVVWLQTLPLTLSKMMHIVFAGPGIPGTQIEADLREVYKTRHLMGLLPLFTTQPLDSGGLEFISFDGVPFNVQLFTQERQPHWALIGQQRKAGKSNVMTYVINQALARGQPVSAIDLPSSDDSSSLRDLCEFHEGSHIDLQHASNNLLSIPSSLLLSEDLPDEVRKDRFNTLLSYWLESLMILGGPPASEDRLVQTSRDLLQMAIDLYINDSLVQERYVTAARGGFGSPEWELQPTLQDFIKFVSQEKLQHLFPKIRDSSTIKDALAGLQIRLGRKADPTTVIGAALSRASTVDVEKTLLNVFSLRNLNPGSEESSAYILSANTYAMQASINHSISHIIIEEAQNLADYPGILHVIADVASRGGKAGIRLGIVTNSFNKLAQTKEGQVLKDNLQVKFIGSIQSESVRVLSDPQIGFDIPADIIKRCTRNTFSVNKQEGCSSWLIKIDDHYYFGRIYTPWISAALNASNAHERKCRKRFFDVIVGEAIGDKHDAISAFAYYFRACAQVGREMSVLERTQVIGYLEKCLQQ
jgi:hypothetical protein